MSRTVAVRAVLLAGALGWATACSDSSGPGSQVDRVPGLIVSSPVVGSAGSLSAGTPGATALVGGTLVYVSLVPGSVPTGLQATITDQATGLAVTTAVVNGGFDPVAIPASIGDTLRVEITRSDDTPLYGFDVVRASRPPVVVRTSPPPGGRDVPLNATIVIIFSEPLDPATVDTGSVRLWRGSTPVPGTVRFADVAHLRAEFHPDSLLAGQTDYELVLGQGIRDVGGEALDAAVTVPFTTGTTSGDVATAVLAIVRYDGVVGWTGISSVKSDGTDLTQLTTHSGSEAPKWSPDGTKLAFWSWRFGNAETYAEIYVMDADGQNQVRLTSNAYDVHLRWSPDGTKLAFTRARDGIGDIYVMDADGQNQLRLTSNDVDDVQPEWSPDGTKLAFWSRRDGNAEIYVMNADGSNQVRLTNDAGHNVSATWSPDGTKLAFWSWRDGNAEIYVMKADGSNQVRLTNDAGLDIDPHWSPDGTKLAFMSTRDDLEAIYLMNADGSNQVRLTNAHVAFNPTWSPDGAWIAFDASFNGYFVGLVRADGSGLVELVVGALQPAWRP